MHNTFNLCTKIIELDLDAFNVESVKNFPTTFTSMTSLKRLNISTWNPKEVVDLLQSVSTN